MISVTTRAFALSVLITTALHAQVPQLINYQGRVAVNGLNFKGSGQFKFALVNGEGTTTYWSNDGTSAAGSEPTAAVKLTVTKGLYSVLLGDATLANMATIPASVLETPGVLLRVWFNDGIHGSQLLTPDQRLAAGHAGQARDGGATTPDAWQQGSGGAAPVARPGHTAVWTGSEMIVWGGYYNDGTSHFFNDGGRYNPATNSWRPVSLTGAPAGRWRHTAVWTGSEMIVWGGQGRAGFGGAIALNDGGRYNPAENKWTALTTAGAPFERQSHTAVWTGVEMIVWGGEYGGQGNTPMNTGGRYNPATDRWVSMVPASYARWGYTYTAVWTGSEMIVWGGVVAVPSGVSNGGARYDPAADRWTNFGGPTARADHGAVWTGSEMIIWGGVNGTGEKLNDGWRYDPAGESWTAVSTTGAPTARRSHTAVWTGSEMIVWGGLNAISLNDGGRYDPAGNTWTSVSTTGAPAPARNSIYGYTAVWTGREMIVWGGYEEGSPNEGGRYDPAGDRWAAVTSAPTARRSHTAVWTGSEMIVWGGFNAISLNDGGRYDPAGNTWTSVSTTDAPVLRDSHTAVWTGSEMIVWGGDNGTALNDGGRYNPVGNTWTSMSLTGAPSSRLSHTAVWTGSEMIVWGGKDATPAGLNDGGRYDPEADSWTLVNATGAPVGRDSHTAVWTGSEMIVWGGDNGGVLNDGARYDPAADGWTLMNATGAPAARLYHTAVWTGSEMIVWGGKDATSTKLNDGGRYIPTADSWTAVSTSGAPAARQFHTAVWTGSEMIVWGGDNDGVLNDGGRYHPAGDGWAGMSTLGAPAGREGHTAIWTGREMIVWGGQVLDGATPIYFDDTFIYTPGCAAFPVTGVVLSGGNLIVSFPSAVDCTYTLWRSITLADGNWTDTGLPPLSGTGATLSFTVPALSPASSFFRVQARQ